MSVCFWSHSFVLRSHRMRMVHPFSHRAVSHLPFYAQNFSSWGYMLADSEKRDLHHQNGFLGEWAPICSKVVDGERHHTCEPRYVCTFTYFHTIFRRRPCSHFKKEDWTIINHNPWLRQIDQTKTLLILYFFMNVCCDSSQKQARKACRQRSL